VEAGVDVNLQVAEEGRTLGNCLAFLAASLVGGLYGGSPFHQAFHPSLAALEAALVEVEQKAFEEVVEGKKHHEGEGLLGKDTLVEEKERSQAFGEVEVGQTSAVVEGAELVEAELASAYPFQAEGVAAGSVQIEAVEVLDLELPLPLAGEEADLFQVGLAGPAIWVRLRLVAQRQGRVVHRFLQHCLSRRTSCSEALQTAIVAFWLDTAPRNYRASLHAYLLCMRMKRE